MRVEQFKLDKLYICVVVTPVFSLWVVPYFFPLRLTTCYRTLKNTYGAVNLILVNIKHEFWVYACMYVCMYV